MAHEVTPADEANAGRHEERALYCQLDSRKPPITFQLLPVELCRPIVELIADRPTLLSLCLTSQTLKFEAQRVLYDTVDTLSMASNAGFLRTVTEVDRLALLVHKFHMNGEMGSLNSTELLNAALQAMVNLRDLFFTSTTIKNTLEASAPKLNVFDGCKFQLEVLCISQYLDVGAFFSFLNTQKKLRRLAVYLVNQGQPPPSGVCPKLHSLQGNRATIESLLPNRQITTVIWDPDFYDARRSVPHLSQPLRALKALSFEGCYLRPSLRSIVDHLESLEYLELVTLHAGEIADICKLTNLRALVLTDAFSFGTWKRRLSTVLPIFTSCQRLKYIDMEQVHYYSGSQQSYQRWTCPHGSAPVMVGLFKRNFVRQPFSILLTDL